MEKGHIYSKLSLWVIYAACWKSSLGRFILPAVILEPLWLSTPHSTGKENSNCEKAAPLSWCDIKQHNQRGVTISVQQNLDQDKMFCLQKIPLSLCELAGEYA